MKNQFLIAILCLVGSFSLSAQSIYYNYGQDNFLRLEFNRPIFSDDFDAKFFTFDAFLNGEFRVGKKDKISFEIPFSRFAFDSFGSGFSDTRLGSIAIGYQVRNLEKPSYFDFKLRLPTADDDGLSIVFTDFTERFTSVFPNIVSIEGSYNFESKNLLGWYFRFKPGAKLLIPTNDETLDDLELFIDMNILGGYRTEKFDVNAGITTTTIATAENIDFEDRILRQLVSTFTYTTGAWKPGLIFRIPLGDEIFGDTFDIAIGVHVGYNFGNGSRNDSAKE
jgi:hypothetical protein